MTDIQEVPVVEVETPATAEVVPPTEEPVAPVEEEVKQAETRTFTQEEHERAIQAAKAKLERKYERELRQRLESENEALRQRSEPKPVEAPGRPEREQYQNDIDYIRAEARWEADQRFKVQLDQWNEQNQKQAQIRQFQEVKQTYEKRAAEVRRENPDFDELVKDPDLPISEPMAVAIALSDNGPKLALYLAKNQDEAERIYRLPPALAQMELGKLEMKISGTTPKKISTAPAPLGTVNSTKAIVADLSNLSQEEYEKKRRKMGARW